MARLNIQISETVKEVAEARASEAGHRSLDAYIESLILADASEDLSDPEHLRVRSQEYLADLLREGEAIPAREMVPADWNEMRRELTARHTAIKAV